MVNMCRASVFLISGRGDVFVQVELTLRGDRARER
jgi:hypothetical protein